MTLAAAFLGFLLACSCVAERSLVVTEIHNHFSAVEHDIEESASRGINAISSNICGGPDIQNMIAKRTDVAGVRLLPAKWTKITHIADEFLQGQIKKISQLDSDVKRLAVELKQLEAAENHDSILPAQVKELVSAAVMKGYGSRKAEQDYGPLKIAKESKCSFKAIREKVAGKTMALGRPADFRKSEEEFHNIASKFFDGKIRSDSETFVPACMEVFDSNVEWSSTSCDELCYSFADTAQDLSDNTAGNTGVNTVSVKFQELAEKQNEYQFAVKQKEECERSKENLASFGEELTGLNEDIKRKSATAQQAQDMFDEADMELEELQEDLTEQAATTKQIQEIFEANSKATMQAKKLYDEIDARKLELQEQLKQTEKQVEDAGNVLRKAMKADEKISELKTTVSEIMLKMVLYFDETVRAPMFDLGLGFETNIGEYFKNHASRSKVAASVVAKNLEHLSKFCQDDATPVLQAVEKVDLSPMCKLRRTPTEISEGIDTAVNSRMNEVQRQLETAQSYLDPYKGNKGMTEDAANKRVNAWEPQGLQEVKGVFDMSPFWKYLKEWELEGTFHSLYNSFGKAKQELAVMKQKAEEALKETQQFLNDTIKKSQKAAKVLKKGIADEAVTSQEKAAAEKALALLENELAAQELNLKKLQEASANALKAYEQAKQNLVAAHSAGISAE